MQDGIHAHGTVYITLQASTAGPVWTNAIIPPCADMEWIREAGVLRADIAKLAQVAATIWLHSKHCFSSFAHRFSLALRKIFLIEAPLYFSCKKWQSANTK